uniref:NADH-ubiquinone oxidoreductase chain 3 n=1 Tax=Quadristernoseta cf. longigynium XFX-2019 TaxID=2695872 RepID=A0A6B9WFV7_9ACAR|nr:NADH dehydrogenase subunit 3 [Quadristernoseta cf. longigynium XFX-2019]
MLFTMIMLISLMIYSIFMLLSKLSFNDKENFSPFECGFDQFMTPRNPFSLRFFKITMIFLIFDVEITLILPMILNNNHLNFSFLLSSYTLLLIILFGLLYEWYLGALNWMS